VSASQGFQPPDRHQPQVTGLDAGSVGERFQDRQRRVPVQIVAGGVV